MLEGPNIKAQLLYVLAFFHALISERRTYLPQGWSKFYEFSYGDLKAGSYIIESIVGNMENNQMNWETLYGLFNNAIYGGRIDGYFDCKVLKAYCEHYFNPKMMQGSQKLPFGQLSIPDSTSIDDYKQ